MISLKEAEKFHGHLGPWLVLGLLIGDAALKKLKAEKYFGLEAEVRGANRKPRSCLVDGLQISSGCTYGKGNIRKIAGDKIRVILRNLENNKKVSVSLKGDLLARLNALNGHRDSRVFARALLKADPDTLFEVRFS
jgi:formylmethanofuran dehydrogenase subunit E